MKRRRDSPVSLIEMAYYVYVIKSSKTGRHYVGSTKDIKQRLKQHNNNKTRSLKNKGPFQAIHTEQYNTLSEARKREIQIKKYKGGMAFKKLIGVL